jgi:replicative DNA helicase
MSLDLLSILSTKEAYERYNGFLNKDILSAETQIIADDLKAYYEETGEQEVDWEQFEEWFKYAKHSGWDRTKHQAFSVIFEALSTHTPSKVQEAIVESFVLRDYYQEIADVALRGAEGQAVSMEKITELIESCNHKLDRVSKLDSFFVTDDIQELVADVEGGYSWRMSCLNRSIGRLRSGKLVCFAARPNVGKTTWLASEMTHMAEQIEDDECILWFNNEESGSDVKLRLIQAATGCTGAYIEENPVNAMNNYRMAIGNVGKIKILDKADISTRDVEEIVKRYKPKIIVFDQLHKVHGFEKSSSTDTARLGNIYQWAREIAKTYAPVVSVHQVKTEGEGVEYLTPDMLYLSGTVIQSEVDGLILMGRNHIAGQNNRRFIAIGKVKGAYGKEVNPDEREGQYEVEILPDTAQFNEEEHNR